MLITIPGVQNYQQGRQCITFLITLNSWWLRETEPQFVNLQESAVRK